MSQEESIKQLYSHLRFRGIKKIDKNRMKFDKEGNIVQLNLSQMSKFNKKFPFESTVFDKLEVLNLSFNRLTDIPKSVKNLPSLRKLIYTGNMISKDSKMGELSNLEELVFDHENTPLNPHIIKQMLQGKNLNFTLYKTRQMPFFPGKIFEEMENLQVLSFSNHGFEKLSNNFSLSQLKKLNLSKNKIREYPEFINGLTNLQYLDLGDNLIKNIPNEIGKLKQLIYLDLSKNIIRTLPNSITDLVNLESLILSYNKLSELPDDIDKLYNLERLIVDANNLKSLPKKISALKNLIIFSVSTNLLTNIPSLPENIVDLNLSGNYLKRIHPSITSLRNLKTLQLQENHIEEIPSGMVNLDQIKLCNLTKNNLNPVIRNEVLVWMRLIKISGGEVLTI